MDITLLRQVAKIMDKGGFNLNSFSSTIRLKNLLDYLKMPEEKIESFLENLSVHSYKRGVEDKEYFLLIDEIINLAKGMKISIYDIPRYIEQNSQELIRLDKEISDRNQKILNLYHAYNVTEEDLRYYRLRQPIMDKLMTSEENLKIKENENLQLKREIEDLTKLITMQTEPDDGAIFVDSVEIKKKQ